MTVAVSDVRRRIGQSATFGAARRQLGVSSAQWAAGLGNLAFALLVARVLTPSAFAELGAFLSGYVLLHLPAAGIGAGAALYPSDLVRRRRQLGAAGLAVGAGIAFTTPQLSAWFGLPTGVVLALAAAAPAAALLGLERGTRLGTGRHGRVAAGLLAEPLVRLSIGLGAAVALGPTGAAIAVTAAGYAALWATRGGELVTSPPSTALRAGRTGTTLAFALFAVLQQQDLLVAKLRLAPDAAGTFTMLSTAGGAVAFATALLPLALLPSGGRSRQDDRVAIALAVVVGVAATAVTAGAGTALVVDLFGAEYRQAGELLPAYTAAMGMLGVGRVLAARSCARGDHRRMAVAVGSLVALHLILLALVDPSPRGMATATFAATTAGVAVLVTPPGVVSERARRAVAAVGAWASTRDLVLLGAFTATALVVRLVATRGLWVDEAITVSQAQLPFGAMLEDLRVTDVHPPLHHAIVWALTRVAGTSELAVRLPSIVAGALLVPVAHGLAKALYGVRTGLVAAALVSVAPFLVWYSQEARMYSMFILLATGSLWAQVSAIRGGGRWAWVAYAGTTAAMLWTQWFAVFPLAAQQAIFLAVLIRRRHDRDARRALVAGWVLSLAAVAALCAPLVPIATDQLDAYQMRRSAGETDVALAPGQAGTAASSFSTDLSVYTVGANAIWAVAGYHSDAAMTSVAALWPLLLLAGLGALGRGRSDATNALLLCIALPAALFLAAGVVKRDLFELRYFAAVVPLLLVLAARTVTSVFPRPRTQGAIALVAVALLSGALVDQQMNGANPRRYDFEGALSTVRAQADPDDVILYAPEYLSDVVDYYAPDVPARSIDARNHIDVDGSVWLVATTRVADEARTSAEVGRALADLEQDGRRTAAEHTFANVQLWELE